MNLSSGSEGNFDFEVHRKSAVESYQRIRPIYEAFAETIKAILAQALDRAHIKVASIEARAKSIDSFGVKASTPSNRDESRPKYSDPLHQITDLAGVRIITFFPRTVSQVDQTLWHEFTILERIDKADLLIREEKLGYQSLHYVIALQLNRLALPEYARYAGLKAEIQVRTILQHAWAEIEHDIQYKSVEVIPTPIRRRFMTLAGLLEIADREFQAIQNEDEQIRQEARRSVQAGRLEEVEITPDALRAYLDKKLGPDRRMRDWTYESTAAMLRRFGFNNFRELEECIAGYNDDEISKRVWGGRQGQLTRFETMLLAGMGERFINEHQLGQAQWWRDWQFKTLAKMKALGIPTGVYNLVAADTRFATESLNPEDTA